MSMDARTSLDLAQKVFDIKSKAHKNHTSQSNLVQMYDTALDDVVKECQVLAFTTYLTEHGYRWQLVEETRIWGDGTRSAVQVIEISKTKGKDVSEQKKDVVAYDTFILGFRGARAIIDHFTKATKENE